MTPRVLLYLSIPVVALVVGPSTATTQGTFASIKTVHFNVQYQRGVSEEDARSVAEYLQKDYNYLSEKLGIDLKKRLDVRIYDSVGKFLAQSSQRLPWRGGIYHRGVFHLQPVQALVQRKLFERTLSFELAMALLEQAGAKGCPRWLRESFAVYHSGEMASLTPPIGVKLASFSDLDQDIQHYPNPPQREDVHFILGTTMKFFVEKYGEAKAMSVFKAFDGMTSLDEVFKKTFKQEFQTIERTWANFILASTESYKIKRSDE
jgi:hypothetical protein